MMMTREEMVRHYAQAANKAKDIKVLADLNCVTPGEIRAALAQAGVEAPKRTRTKKPAAGPAPTPAPVQEPALPPVYGQAEAILAALPEGASHAVRRRAGELLADLFRDYLLERLGLNKERQI